MVNQSCLTNYETNKRQKTEEPDRVKIFLSKTRVSPYKLKGEASMSALLQREEVAESRNVTRIEEPPVPLEETKPSRLNLTQDVLTSGVQPSANAPVVKDYRKVTLLGGDGSATRNLLTLNKSSYLEQFQTGKKMAALGKNESIISPAQREQADTSRTRRHFENHDVVGNMVPHGHYNERSKLDRSVSKGVVRYMNNSQFDIVDPQPRENESAKHLAELRKQKPDIKKFSFVANAGQQQEARKQREAHRIFNVSASGADLISPRGQFDAFGSQTARHPNKVSHYNPLLSPSAGVTSQRSGLHRVASLKGEGLKASLGQQPNHLSR